MAIALAEAASGKTGAVVAPPLWFGWSPHHMVLPGTITVRPEILAELVYDVMESLAKHGCRKFVLINGHRLVNIPWMQIACERARRLLGVQVALFDLAYMCLRPRSCTAWIPGTREIYSATFRQPPKG